MPNIYLPDHLAIENHREFLSKLLRCTTLDDPLAQEWTTKLQQIRTDLWMRKAYDTVDADLPLMPGYYHVIKVNEGAPASVFPVTDDNGNFTEPTSRVFERLAQGDLSQRRVRDRVLEQDRIVEAAVARENQRANETRREELTDRLKAAMDTRISFNRDTPWTQNVAGRKGKKA